jgi:hypothetical protein
LVQICKFCVHFLYRQQTELYLEYSDCSRGSSVTIVTRPQAGRSVFQTPSKARYRVADKSLAHPTSRCILFDSENIPFDASLVIYTNSTNIPTIMIINRIYEHQNLLSLLLVSFLVGLRTYQRPCIFSSQNIIANPSCYLIMLDVLSPGIKQPGRVFVCWCAVPLCCYLQGTYRYLIPQNKSFKPQHVVTRNSSEGNNNTYSR